ncbi:CsbD-like [Cryobacterium psychrotolerans]|uniref:CsbD-like n=1 Tax=Cryobacterium psychrotolerans TaxID=386301 RepID=A0A1G9HTM5_9MICO|nr:MULTISPECIES: CsbD family protein [Cryobacterium]TFD45804.1 CsbD family protein [Cryobacterium sp. TMT1-2-1]TFD85720.1 CsbD family protein [Cryobacterium psychrotolerans]SDL16300.1 CsbD-like [Cryobacterium psychrotolerans]
MGADDKIKNAAQDLAGKGKEAAGRVTDNERLEAEGNADQAEAKAKKVGEDVKDAFR